MSKNGFEYFTGQAKWWYRAILGQLENVVKNIYPEGAMFAGMLGHMPFLLKDN